jgi:23S rRNA (cytidine1920-2'-O)/16S rRNA (cytidine1409-2'-O)-methyltransferase
VSKVRADILVHAQGLTASRELAARLVKAGKVAVLPDRPDAPPRIVGKPGQGFPDGTRFLLLEEEPYVSRGAYKLLTLLEAFSLDVRGHVCLDAGASTGGFTDCLLQRGASKVYAVDVGRDQLHGRLRADPRVTCLEGVNLRHAPPSLLPERVDVLVADVSFISLTLVLPACMAWLKPEGWVGALIKPQFELGGKGASKGVVRSPEARQAAVDKVADFCRERLGLVCRGIVPAAVKGPKGNQEFMGLFLPATDAARRGTPPASVPLSPSSSCSPSSPAS